MSIQIPTPETFEQAVWLGMGIIFGRSFGKKLDWDIQQGEWFKGLHPILQGTVKRMLDATHHWWLGALIMLYLPVVNIWGVMIPIYWWGLGLVLDDLPDIPPRIRKTMTFEEPEVEDDPL